MTHIRKLQFWLDNAAGTLAEMTSDINQAALQRAVEILENTHINEDDRSIVAGIRSAKLPLNGYYNDTSPGIIEVLDQAQGTSVSKTWQIKSGTRYHNGECFPAGLEFSGDGKALVTWSCTLEVDGAVNRTSAPLA